MPGNIEAVSDILFTSPTTQCGLQAAARRVVERALWVEARSIGSHCGGQTTGCSTTSASLLATQGFVVFGMSAAHEKAATMQMRTSARELNACFFAYTSVEIRVWGSGCMAGGWHGFSRTGCAHGGLARGVHGECVEGAWERCMGNAWVVHWAAEGVSRSGGYGRLHRSGLQIVGP